VVRAGAALFAGTGYLLSQVSKPEVQVVHPPAQPPEVQQPDPDAVSAAVLGYAYQTNEALADQKYTGRRVRITGRLLRIERARLQDGTPIYQLEMGSGERFDPNTGRMVVLADPLLRFTFPLSARDRLAPLNKGQKVTVEGRSEGRAGMQEVRETLYFFDCELIRAGD
jgi:hypothetical protein